MRFGNRDWVAGLTASTFGALALTACVASGGAGDGSCEAVAALRGTGGQDLGSVKLIETARGTLVQARLRGMPPGVHAIHLHEKGQCQPEFGAAGGHYNPTAAGHGFLGSQGHHLGDLPNFSVAASGEGFLDAFAGGLRVCGGDMPLLDGDGAAVIIHRGEDDYRTDPAGGAGERIACGVVSK